MSFFIPVIFGLCFFCSLSLGGAQLYRNIRLYRFGKWADGRFMSVVGDYMSVWGWAGGAMPARARFFTENGQRYEIDAIVWWPQKGRSTRALRVVYWPHEPEKAVAYSIHGFWIAPLCWLGGALFSGVFFISSLMEFFTA